MDIKPERLNFKTLLLQNPNYFGTLPKLGGVPVQKINFDTTFEQLTCLGLSQAANRLEAVIQVKQASGYGSDACGSGTPEYVRFFVQDATGWHDLGLASATVYNLTSSPLPLSYSVSVSFSEARKFCGTENIVNTRAILSWDFAPPADDPNFIPVWGNVLDARVQVAPLFIFDITIAELLKEGELALKADVLPAIDVTKHLPAKKPVPLQYAELKNLYANQKVPAHRYGFSDAMKLLSGPIDKALPAQAPSTAAAPPGLSPVLTAGPELGGILGALQGLSGDTTFEELTCAGYNPQTRELEAVIAIKQNAGYSGGLCSAGSTEYVSFFAFFSGAWQPLGSAQVQVHDLAAAKPLMYAVYRISNLPEVACKDLTGIPLRAILSWATPPTGPNFVPVWGNVLNTNIQPIIGTAGPGEQARLMRIGRVTVSGINDVTGLANPTGVAGDCNNANDSPFGGETIVEGDFTPKVDVFNPVTGMVLPGAKPIIYQVWVTRTDIPSLPFQLINPFGIALFPPNDLTPPVIFSQSLTPAPGPVVGGVAGTEYYTYMESNTQAVNPRTLAAFEAGGLPEGNYYIEVRGFLWDGLNYVPITPQGKTIHVYNGYPHFELGTLVNRPQVSLTLTNVGDCGTTPVGTIIQGSYSVTDEFFSSVSVVLVPIFISGVQQPAPPVVLSNANDGPSAVVYNGLNTNGTSGTFTLDTNGMTPCGYNIRLVAWDRALVSSSCSGHWNEEDVGFCLSPKKS